MQKKELEERAKIILEKLDVPAKEKQLKIIEVESVAADFWKDSSAATEKMKEMKIRKQQVWEQNTIVGSGFSSQEDLSGYQFLLISNFVSGQQKRIDEFKVEVEILEKELEEARDKYVQAQKQRRIIETLREKDYSKYKKALLKDELKKLDDIYTSRSGTFRGKGSWREE